MLLGVVMIYLSIQSKHDVLDQKIASTAESISTLFNSSVIFFSAYYGDEAHFENLMSSIAEKEHVVSLHATVTNENGKARFDIFNPVYGDTLERNEKKLIHTAPLVFSMEENPFQSDQSGLEDPRVTSNYGITINVLYSNYFLEEAFLGDVYKDILLFLFLYIGLALSMFYLFTRSLNKLVVQVERVIPGMLSTNSEVDPLPCATPIREINRLNIMSNRLYSEILRYQRESYTRIDLHESVSHDLNGPLNQCISRLRWVSSEMGNVSAVKDKLSQAVMEVKVQLEFLQMKSNSVMKVRSLQKGSIKLNPIWVSLNELKDDVEFVYRPMADEKQISLSVTVEGNVSIYQDKSMLSILLSNAVENAVKYTDEGHVHVELQASNSEFRFQVTDTGCGLTEDQIALLKTDPRRLKSATVSKAIPGWGVGMVTIKEVCKLQEGQYEIASPGLKGTTFTYRQKTDIKTIKTFNSSPDLKEKFDGSVKALITDDESSYFKDCKNYLDLDNAECVDGFYFSPLFEGVAWYFFDPLEQPLDELFKNTDWDIAMVDYHLYQSGERTGYSEIVRLKNEGVIDDSMIIWMLTNMQIEDLFRKYPNYKKVVDRIVSKSEAADVFRDVIRFYNDAMKASGRKNKRD